MANSRFIVRAHRARLGEALYFSTVFLYNYPLIDVINAKVKELHANYQIRY